MNDKLTFYDVLMQTAAVPEFIKEFDRLAGTDLGKRKSPIIAEIDRVTGKERDDILKFIQFVYDFIWLRLDPSILTRKR